MKPYKHLNTDIASFGVKYHGNCDAEVPNKDDSLVRAISPRSFLICHLRLLPADKWSCAVRLLDRLPINIKGENEAFVVKAQSAKDLMFAAEDIARLLLDHLIARQSGIAMVELPVAVLAYRTGYFALVMQPNA